jgi:hypothetical protein
VPNGLQVDVLTVSAKAAPEEIVTVRAAAAAAIKAVFMISTPLVSRPTTIRFVAWYSAACMRRTTW